ncbi:hypothetical protein MTO96_024634 [Rhipicephalus appendiculatus]
MFKFTLHLLLCTAVFSAHTPDLFKGCVPCSGNHTAPHTCTMIPNSALHTHRTYYAMLAEAVLQKSSHQPHEKLVNTLYNVTRAAVKVSVYRI